MITFHRSGLCSSGLLSFIFNQSFNETAFRVQDSAHPLCASSDLIASLLLKKQIKCQENIICCLSESVARTNLLALVSASLFFADPALAYKGGGPYGSEVTRGQDLTGKDFSGKTLIKQDFKTVLN
ncbi:hypothetical protein Ddye_017099 [Dipteronia dyeriana]|uniref:Uncharacterized protein n=1 Tax=Dipteronia dyeriana TaxID=168575 RepID=A0AAD9U816_9ROSI|nr:hypothetical protein Ddye_017099 [Dipteronia dyeriana]